MIEMVSSPDAARIGAEMTTTRASEPAKKIRRFDEVFGQMVTDADSLRKESHETLKAFERGEVQDVHQVMMSITKADLSFRMMMEVRSKLLESYQTIMRLTV